MKEKELIVKAKRDEEVADIEDSVTKEKLAAQLNKLKNEKDLLTKEAVTILLQATKDKQGTIIVIKASEGNTIQINKKEFGNIAQRAFSKYEAALGELIKINLIKRLGYRGTGEAFELTSSGWETADKL
jgi:hypothetical protein